MENFIEIYNPRNASSLSDEQKQAMQHLTDDQIKQLAEAYPNQPTGNAYLQYLITNEPLDKQRFPLGTWKNLYSLRKMGKKEIVPFGFVTKNIAAAKTTAVSSKNPVVKKVVDLSAGEKIEGLVENQFDANAEAAKDFTEAETGTEVEQRIEMNAVTIAEKNLAEAKEAGAHPQTIKKLERDLAAAIEAAKTV